MQKQIELSGHTFILQSNAYTPIAYKKEFGKDYFQDLFQMLQAKSILNALDGLEEGEELTTKDIDLEILSDFDMTFFHRLFWVFVKSGNRAIKPFEEFFMEIEEFPLQEVGPVLMEMLQQGMTTRKKSMGLKRQARKSSQ
ncbi:TPA: hypothetical protein TZM69_000343 [Streptococcus suis]|uniref:hypothetical protein n=1 Tax=Streptococcus suis TaxID=1307 RepID=UPI002A78B362|nr:hypothetical protein [Streptococcus suis]HEL1739374.1 hypothetical protein [Streptococcus suis]HEL2045654.1 hypothetical protein [Streptococcus suis]HEL2171802.1 hypothetical protein [Streptococcus suis]HEL2302468.1 hypothetical protein [Streptococcus suis]